MTISNDDIFETMEKLIKEGFAVALPSGDDVLYKHVEHCSDSDLRQALTEEQRRAAYDRARNG